MTKSTDKEITALLKEYQDRFSDNFPLFVFRGTDKEVKRVVEKCLRDNKPFVFKDDGSRDY